MKVINVPRESQSQVRGHKLEGCVECVDTGLRGQILKDFP
jgi:hypothetical protein